MMISARASRCVRWPFSCFSLRTSSKTGSRLDWGPRWRGARPRARCWRQGVRCEEERPSRRSMAPIAPGALAESASAKMRFLYSAEYWRRLALTTTSGSGIVLASPGATLRSASLRSASLRSAPGEAKTTEGGGTPFTDFFMSISFSALYTKSRKGRRLTDLGTEGARRGQHTAVSDQDQLLQLETLPQFVDLRRYRFGIPRVTRKNLHGHRAALGIGQQSEDNLRVPVTLVTRMSKPRQPAAMAFEVSGTDVIQNQGTFREVAFGQGVLDTLLTRQQPIHGVIELGLIGRLVQTEHGRQRGGGGIGMESGGGGQLGGGFRERGGQSDRQIRQNSD